LFVASSTAFIAQVGVSLHVTLIWFSIIDEKNYYFCLSNFLQMIFETVAVLI